MDNLTKYGILIINFIIIITIISIISILTLYLFKKLKIYRYLSVEHNTIAGLLINVMALFLGVLLSFLIVTAWGLYTDADKDNQNEAEYLYILYEIVRVIPNTEEIQLLIIEYLEYIINVEFPELKRGNLPPEQGTIFLKNIQQKILNIFPNNVQESTLYSKAISTIDNIITLRVNRTVIATNGLNFIIWLITIVYALLLIFIILFIDLDNFFHYVLLIMVSIYITTGLYTTYLLATPFFGLLSLNSTAYQEALDNINIVS